MSEYKEIVRCQNRDQIIDLVRLWMDNGAIYRNTWLRTPSAVAGDMGQRQVLSLRINREGRKVITNWSPSWYRDCIAGSSYYAAEFEGTYLEYMKYIGQVNMPVDVSDYL